MRSLATGTTQTVKTTRETHFLMKDPIGSETGSTGLPGDGQLNEGLTRQTDEANHCVGAIRTPTCVTKYIEAARRSTQAITRTKVKEGVAVEAAPILGDVAALEDIVEVMHRETSKITTRNAEATSATPTRR